MLKLRNTVIEVCVQSKGKPISLFFSLLLYSLFVTVIAPYLSFSSVLTFMVFTISMLLDHYLYSIYEFISYN